MANYYPSPDFSAATISTTGAAHVGGNFDVATTKFTVAAASGNTAVAGTLGVTGTSTLAAVNISGDVAVATNKFTVAAASGNTVVAGTLGVTGVATFTAAPVTPAGSINAASIAIGGDVNTGPVLVGADYLAWTVGGTYHMQMTGSEVKPLVRFTAGAQMCLNSIISPSLTGSVNDYAPTNIATCNVMRISSDGAYNITGLGGGATGNQILMFNISAFSLTLKHASASSSSGAKFACPGNADYVVTAGSCAVLWYDATSLVWRVIGGVA
jgi:hypothetical protein